MDNSTPTLAQVNPESGGHDIEIRSLLPNEDASAFRRLNEEWITRYFVLEPMDMKTLSDPGKAIFGKGGRIFIAYANGEPVGCAALVPMENGVVELAKMAVDPHYRGQGIGRRVLEYAIEQARAMGARSIFLGSSTKLPAALHLYESAGFRHVLPESVGPMPYARADVVMQLWL